MVLPLFLLLSSCGSTDVITVRLTNAGFDSIHLFLPYYEDMGPANRVALTSTRSTAIDVSPDATGAFTVIIAAGRNGEELLRIQPEFVQQCADDLHIDGSIDIVWSGTSLELVAEDLDCVGQ